MQGKNKEIFFVIIPEYYLSINCLPFLWHSHCSYGLAVQVKGVDNILLMRLECPNPALNPKALDKSSTL